MRSCRACGATEFGAQLTVREAMFGTGEQFPYAPCGTCGTVHLLDIPADLSPYYPEDYYSVDLDPEQIFGPPHIKAFTALVTRSLLFGTGSLATTSRWLIARREFQTLMSILDGVRATGLAQGRQTAVLDVGCGSGVLIHALALSGMVSVTGVDPFAPGDRTLRSGARILKRELDEIEGRYDLVMFHHSFEHVLDPGASLAAAAQRLRPGGAVLIRMPTVTSDSFQHYGSDWVQLDAPRHLTVFSREGVRRLAAEHGMTVVDVVDDSTSFQFWGSEQAKAGIAFNAPTSQFVNPKASMFSTQQIQTWDREARRLNAIARGDQAAWILRPVDARTDDTAGPRTSQ